MEIQVPAANIAFEPLKLGHLRDTLIRLEDSIVFALIERAQFKRNDKIYLPRAFEFPGDPGISFLEYMLKETEKVHAKVRRYTSPDEHPFSPIESLPSPILPEVFYPKTIISNDINLNEQILKSFLNQVIPGITREGDDGNYGSCSLCDVSILQCLSKRIHYGKFVAEVKYVQHPEKFKKLVEAGDRNGIWNMITDSEVEMKVLERVELKARTYGKDPASKEESELFIDPKKVREIYEQIVIPFTKEVQILYLYERVDC